MNEHPLLAQLAQLTGEFIIANNPSTTQLEEFRNSVATALLQEQPSESIQQNFQFQNMANYATADLKTDDLEALNQVLENASVKKAGEENIRVFQREVPFVSSQVKGSVPEWAHGAEILKSIGPLINKAGRKIWLDLYTILPGVKIYLQGAAQPAMVLTLKMSKLSVLNQFSNSYTIPESSIWINAHLFASIIPDTQYFGLKVKSGTINFSNKIILSNNTITIPAGITANLDLQLSAQAAPAIIPDDFGLDAEDVEINLPSEASFSFSTTAVSIVNAGSASWKLYGQDMKFSFQKNKAPFFLQQLNRLCFPYLSDPAKLQVLTCKSNVFSIQNEAVVTQAAWSIPCAALDINNPVQANGAGGMAVQTGKGLQISWKGLKDVNLQNKEWVGLNEPWFLIEPGRISIADLKAGNINAKQQFLLWKHLNKNSQEQWNKVDLQYRENFLFIYNGSTANETVLAQTDCTGSIDKPVNVAGIPFELKSKQTILMLSFSQKSESAILYDDNLLTDNNVLINSPVIFNPQSIGLNNALLTVSPLKGFLLNGELKNENEFSKAALIYTFGLMGYLPTLPDPYAADVDILRGQNRINRAFNKEGGIPISAIQQLLIATLTWQNDEVADVNFTWGDILGTTQKNENGQIMQATQQLSLNLLANQQLAATSSALKSERQTNFFSQKNSDPANNLPGDVRQPGRNAVVNNPIFGRLQPSGLFSLLDVSTNADLLGINIGFVNEQLIFQKTFQVQPVDTSKNPLAIKGMDVVATSRFVRIFTVPQISWEPVVNITAPFNITNDPPAGFLKFDNDGFPALIGNTGTDPVALAPIPLTTKVVDNYAKDTNFKAWSSFTLPNGMVSVGRYNQTNQYLPQPNNEGARLELVNKTFDNGIATGWQIVTIAGENPSEQNKVFEGRTQQETNVTDISGNGNWSILGATVTDIFNNEFGNNGVIQRGVPLERYDFTGYGAQVFSNWLNKSAQIAAVSKAIFDVWRGRTAKEVIQVRTILYPWGVHVVRTITMYRGSNGFEFRVDSGWRADSDGLYQFNNQFPVLDASNKPVFDSNGNLTYKTFPGDAPYTFHPGIIGGVINVRNIIENDLAPYKTTWNKTSGAYVNENDGLAYDVHDPVHPLTKLLDVELIGVYFDADVLISDIDGHPAETTIPSKKMVGYLQKSPRGIIISPQDFAKLLDLQNGLGGPVDCAVNINSSGQKMRISRVEVNHSVDETNNIVFVTAAKGMPVLPKDGSWSLVSHNKTSTEVTPITDSVVSLVRKGELKTDFTTHINTIPAKDPFEEITPASELFKKAEDRLTQFGFLQNTDTQKVLFRNPAFKAGENLLHSTVPDLADAYHLLNGKGIFPNLDADIQKIDLDIQGIATKIIDQGYQLVDKAATNVLKSLEQNFPKDASFTFIDKPGLLKVYVEYANTEVEKNPATPPGKLNFDLNSEANEWINKMNDITMVVDLVGMERLFLIRGKFDTQKGSTPEFKGPKLIPGKDLQPIIDILEILEAIGSDPNYADLVKKGLQIAMSNSPNNWEYKFQADKEIPVVQFPPAYLDGPTTPLRLEANLKLGVYFNLAVPVPPTGLPALGAGGFIEFGAKLSVMCVSLAAATVYAVGQVTLRIAGDTIAGPSLYMKLGFGIELMVGIPVVGNVSVLYAVGIEISLDTTQITVAAFIMFRGRAELFGGIVTITIQIEASGKIHKSLNPAPAENRTDCIAQVTFSIDVSVMFVIDINETERWQESRQIA